MEVKIKAFAGRRKHKKNCLHVKIFQPLNTHPPPPFTPSVKQIMVCGFSLLTFSFRGRF